MDRIVHTIYYVGPTPTGCRGLYNCPIIGLLGVHYSSSLPYTVHSELLPSREMVVIMLIARILLYGFIALFVFPF